MFSATVTHCSPVTGSYKIQIDDMESDEEFSAIPVLPYKSIDGMSSARFVYEIGSSVLVTPIESGDYVILGCLPITTERHSEDGSVQTSYGDTNVSKATNENSKLVVKSLFGSVGEDSYTTFEESDLIPGDISLSSPGGSSVKVLRGGSTYIGSDRANIKSNMADGSIRSDCNRYYSSTSMGSLKIEDSPAGSYFLEFLGNCNPKASNPNIAFRIQSNGGKPTMTLSLGDFGIYIDSGGDITLKGKRVLWDDGELVRDLSVSTGTASQEVNEDILSKTTGSRESKTVGNSKTTVAGESHDSAGDFRSITTSGSSVVKKPALAAAPDTVTSRLDTVASGSYSTKIGTPVSGGGSYHLDTYSGDIKLSTNSGVSPLIGGVVGISSTAQATRSGGAYGVVIDSPRSIVGGGFGLNTPGVPSTQSAFAPIPGGVNPTLSGSCKFEALFTYLKALHTMLDSHTHFIPPLPFTGAVAGTACSGVTTPGPTTLPPTSGFSTLTSLVLRIESQSLWLMGN